MELNIGWPVFQDNTRHIPTGRTIPFKKSKTINIDVLIYMLVQVARYPCPKG